MSENINKINYPGLVERRKALQFNKELRFFRGREISKATEEELQSINKQIKDAEWRLMKTLFYMSECYDSNRNSMSQSEAKFHYSINQDIATLIFSPPQPVKFIKINAALNKNNLSDMTQAFLDIIFKENKLRHLSLSITPPFDKYITTLINKSGVQATISSIDQLTDLQPDQKNRLKKFVEKHVANTKNLFKQIDYTENCFPQTSQGNNYFTNQIGQLFDSLRGLFDSEILSAPTSPHLENWKATQNITFRNPENSTRPLNSFSRIDSDNYCDNKINAYLAQREKYENENIDQTFSFFDYLAQDFSVLDNNQKFAQAYNAATYLESRFITCHFDSQWFKSIKQPDETTRDFYMFMWRGSSRLLQNLVRYHLNVPNDLYNDAKVKFRSPDFQRYVLEHKNQANDLLFAFVFCPNEFASKTYDEIIPCAKHLRYYKPIMDIDSLIHEHNFYVDAGQTIGLLFSTLVKLFIEQDNLLLADELLIELSIKPWDTSIEKYLYESIDNLYHNPQIITRNMPLHFKLTCLAAAKSLEAKGLEVDPNIFTDELYFKLLHENCNADILVAAYYIFNKMDKLHISDCKKNITYEMIEQIYIYDVYKCDQKLSPILNDFARTRDLAATIDNIQTNSLSEETKKKQIKKLKPAIEPMLLLISNHIPQNISTDDLRNKLNSLSPKEFNLLAEIIRSNYKHLNYACQDIYKYITNPFANLLDNLAPEIKQTFLNFYHRDIDVFNAIKKWDGNQKRLFILMCLRKEKHFFTCDTFDVVSSYDMNTLFRCFQAIQLLNIQNTTKYEMIMYIRYLIMATQCKQLNPDLLVATVFQDDLVYQLANNPDIRNAFINNPDSYDKTNENEILSFSKRKELAALSSKSQLDSEIIMSLTKQEAKYFIKCFLLGGGNPENLPAEWKKFSITKNLLRALATQEKCVPKIENQSL